MVDTRIRNSKIVFSSGIFEEKIVQLLIFLKSDNITLCLACTGGGRIRKIKVKKF